MGAMCGAALCWLLDGPTGFFVGAAVGAAGALCWGAVSPTDSPAAMMTRRLLLRQRPGLPEPQQAQLLALPWERWAAHQEPSRALRLVRRSVTSSRGVSGAGADHPELQSPGAQEGSSAAAGAMGAAGGAVVGAAVGSALGPAGFAAGARIGAAVGEVAGRKMGNACESEGERLSEANRASGG